MPALQRGDTFAAAFTQGREGNWISLSPDKKIVVLERAAAGKIDLRSPYVCTVKAVGQPCADGTPRSYVAHIDHPLGLRDYDTIIDANFERGTLVLGLKFPTKFTTLRRKEVDAQIEEVLVPARNGNEETLVLTLRHGNLSRSLTISRDEALRRGLRFNHFVRVPPPEGPINAALRHPAPRPPMANWAPSLMEHTGYLLRPTAELLPAIPKALETVTIDGLLGLARRRGLEILAVHAFETLPLDSSDHVVLEQALTAVLRVAFLTCARPEARSALAVAEGRLALRRAHQLPAAELATLLATKAPSFRAEVGGRVSCHILDYLALSGGRTGGAWALCNLDVRAGRAHLSASQAQALVAGCVQENVMADHVMATPDTERLLGNLRRDLETAMDELAALHGKQHFDGLVLDALPPCVAHTLKAALRRGLLEAEAYNAGSLLCRTGLPSSKVNQALFGLAAASRGNLLTPNGSNSRHSPSLHPPTCRINKEIGICAWHCEGIASPMEFYAKKSRAQTEAIR